MIRWFVAPWLEVVGQLHRHDIFNRWRGVEVGMAEMDIPGSGRP